MSLILGMSVHSKTAPFHSLTYITNTHKNKMGGKPYASDNVVNYGVEIGFNEETALYNVGLAEE